MYRIGEFWKFKLKNDFIYSGKILETDNLLVKIMTRHKEEVILSKENISESMRIRSEENDNTTGNV